MVQIKLPRFITRSLLNPTIFPTEDKRALYAVYINGLMTAFERDYNANDFWERITFIADHTYNPKRTLLTMEYYMREGDRFILIKRKVCHGLQVKLDYL